MGDEIALEYQGLCISRLVASYGSVGEVLLDEDLLAAAVILRFYEEVDGMYDLSPSLIRFEYRILHGPGFVYFWFSKDETCLTSENPRIQPPWQESTTRHIYAEHKS